MRYGNSDVGANGAVLSTLASELIIFYVFEKYAQSVEVESHLYLFLFVAFF